MLWGRTSRYGGAPWLVGAVAFVLLAALVRMLTAPFTHDEEQYVAAAVLAAHLRPIVDFPYLQTPLQPMLFAPLMLAAGAHAYAVARFASALLAAGACLLAMPLLRLDGRSTLAAALAAAWLASSVAVQAAMATARNDAMPLCLTFGGVAALAFAERPLRRERGVMGLHLLAGLLFSAALSTKLTYVFAPIGGAVAVALAPILRGERVRRLAAYAAGALIGALPILYVLAAAPAAAMFDLLGFHGVATADWYAQNGEQAQRTLTARLKDWIVAPLEDPALLAALAVLVWRAVLGRRGPALSRTARLVGVLLVLSVPAAFAVNPPNLFYLVAPSALAILLAALVWPPQRRRAGIGAAFAALVWPNRRRQALAAGALVALACLVGDLQLARHALWLAKPSKWTSRRVDADSRELKAALADAPPGPIATVSPIRAIGAGRPIYPAFATGPFVFRSGAAIGAARADTIKAATPENLDRPFAERPPAAILTGLETTWRVQADARLSAYARAHGYHGHRLSDGATLFLPLRQP